jgi:hypothetical protein
VGESWFQQEYGCAFGAMAGLIYPDFARQALRGREPEWREVWARGTRVGGLDFGDAFAAVWGVLDHDGVLWLTDEHYHTGQVLAVHARYLPREVMWYADPSGKVWIRELQHAQFKVRKGLAAVDVGINAVRTRLETGRLRIKPGTCRHLLAEAEVYRWDPDKPGHPLKENDHALDALRYLVARTDQGKMAKWRRWFTPEDGLPPDLPPPRPNGRGGSGCRCATKPCGRRSARSSGRREMPRGLSRGASRWFLQEAPPRGGMPRGLSRGASRWFLRQSDSRAEMPRGLSRGASRWFLPEGGSPPFPTPTTGAPT